MVTHPIGLSPSLSSGAHPLPYPSCSQSYLQVAGCGSSCALLDGFCTRGPAVSNPIQGCLVRVPALATNKDKVSTDSSSSSGESAVGSKWTLTFWDGSETYF